MDFRALIILLSGLFSLFCAVMDFDWFMNARRARFFVDLFGRNGARVVYGLLGLGLMGVGGWLLF